MAGCFQYHWGNKAWIGEAGRLRGEEHPRLPEFALFPDLFGNRTPAGGLGLGTVFLETFGSDEEMDPPAEATKYKY